MQPPSETTPQPPRGDAVSSRPTVPARPERPVSPADQQSVTSGCLGLALAGMGAMFAIAALIFLSSGLLAYAFVVGGVFFAYALFHYAVWGWWLSGRIRREVLEEETDA